MCGVTVCWTDDIMHHPLQHRKKFLLFKQFTSSINIYPGTLHLYSNKILRYHNQWQFIRCALSVLSLRYSLPHWHTNFVTSPSPWTLFTCVNNASLRLNARVHFGKLQMYWSAFSCTDFMCRESVSVLLNVRTHMGHFWTFLLLVRWRFRVCNSNELWYLKLLLLLF